MNIRALTGSAITGIAVLLSTQCLAADMPERFRGVWQAVENESQTCRASDWNSDGHTDTHLKVEAGLVRYHESECRFKTVTRPKPVFDSGAVRVVMACAGEGERWPLTEVWKILSIGGSDVLAMADVSKQRPAIGLYRKCGEGGEKAQKVQRNTGIAAGTAEDPAAGRSDDLRSALKTGRHCFAKRDEGAELSLSIEPSGTALLSIDIANPRTKHLCSLSGTATQTATGWRYVDDSRKDRQCVLDLDVSDRIRFRLNDSECERRYCGARASIASLELSAQDRTRACSPQQH